MILVQYIEPNLELTYVAMFLYNQKQGEKKATHERVIYKSEYQLMIRVYANTPWQIFLVTFSDYTALPLSVVG